MIQELHMAAEGRRFSAGVLVPERPANGGELTDGAGTYDDALVPQQATFQEWIAIAAEASAGTDHPVTRHTGRPARPHDRADGSPGSRPASHRRDIAVGGDPATRNPSHHVAHLGLERPHLVWVAIRAHHRSPIAPSTWG